MDSQSPDEAAFQILKSQGEIGSLESRFEGRKFIWATKWEWQVIQFLGRRGMECTRTHTVNILFCCVAQLKDLYLMITGNDEQYKELWVH